MDFVAFGAVAFLELQGCPTWWSLCSPRSLCTERVEVVMEQQRAIIVYFAVCNVVRYVLFAFRFSSHTASSREFPLRAILSEEAINMADEANKRVQLCHWKLQQWQPLV
ncbi:unnamed protein product [Effrenium voratum]|nr:unnamed protein product [Effrenium voratum]